MKIILKYIVLIIFLISYFLINPFKNILNKELNYLKLSKYFSYSLYEDVMVNNNYIEVIDYYILNDNLYVYPINKEVRLPINVMVNKTGDVIELVDEEEFIKIYNIYDVNYHIYQYVNSGKVLGYSDDYYIIESNNIDKIINKLILNYEAI